MAVTPSKAGAAITKLASAKKSTTPVVKAAPVAKKVGASYKNKRWFDMSGKLIGNSNTEDSRLNAERGMNYKNGAWYNKAGNMVGRSKTEDSQFSPTMRDVSKFGPGIQPPSIVKKALPTKTATGKKIYRNKGRGNVGKFKTLRRSGPRTNLSLTPERLQAAARQRIVNYH